jgi:hypothetical protein
VRSRLRVTIMKDYARTIGEFCLRIQIAAGTNGKTSGSE